jgi:hypothetical protein
VKILNPENKDKIIEGLKKAVQLQQEKIEELKMSLEAWKEKAERYGRAVKRALKD